MHARTPSRQNTTPSARVSSYLMYPTPPFVSASDSGPLSSARPVSAMRTPTSSFTLNSTRHPQHYLATPFSVIQGDDRVVGYYKRTATAAVSGNVAATGVMSGRLGSGWSVTRPGMTHQEQIAMESHSKRNTTTNTNMSRSCRRTTLRTEKDTQTASGKPSIVPPSAEASREVQVLVLAGTEEDDGIQPPSSASGELGFLSRAAQQQLQIQQQSPVVQTQAQQWGGEKSPLTGWRFLTPRSVSPSRPRSRIQSRGGVGDNSSSGRAFLTSAGGLGASHHLVRASASRSTPISSSHGGSMNPAPLDTPVRVGGDTPHMPYPANQRRRESRTLNETESRRVRESIRARQEQRERWVVESLRAYLSTPEEVEEEKGVSGGGDHIGGGEPVDAVTSIAGILNGAAARRGSTRRSSHLAPACATSRRTAIRATTTATAAMSGQSPPSQPQALLQRHSARHREDSMRHRLREALALPGTESAMALQQRARSSTAKGHESGQTDELNDDDNTINDTSAASCSAATVAARFAGRLKTALDGIADHFGYSEGGNDRDRLLRIAATVADQQTQREYARRHPLAEARRSSLDPIIYSNEGWRRTRSRSLAEVGGSPSSAHRTRSIARRGSICARTAKGNVRLQLQQRRQGIPDCVKRVPLSESRAPIAMAAPAAAAWSTATAPRAGEIMGDAPSMVTLLRTHEEAVRQVAALEEAAARSLKDVMDKYDY